MLLLPERTKLTCHAGFVILRDTDNRSDTGGVYSILNAQFHTVQSIITTFMQ